MNKLFLVLILFYKSYFFAQDTSSQVKRISFFTEFGVLVPLQTDFNVQVYTKPMLSPGEPFKHPITTFSKNNTSFYLEGEVSFKVYNQFRISTGLSMVNFFYRNYIIGDSMNVLNKYLLDRIEATKTQNLFLLPLTFEYNFNNSLAISFKLMNSFLSLSRINYVTPELKAESRSLKPELKLYLFEMQSVSLAYKLGNKKKAACFCSLYHVDKYFYKNFNEYYFALGLRKTI